MAGSIVTHAMLAAEVAVGQQEHEAAGRPTTLSPATRMFLRAVAHRTNGVPVLATLPDTDAPYADPAREPARRFTDWLDAGAPGLSAAAIECGWLREDLPVLPGPAPTLTPWSHARLSAHLLWLVRDSHSIYQVAVADPEPLAAAFIAAELGEGRAYHWSCGSADPESLLTRIRYFDRILTDGCLYWTVGHRVRVLLTNGGD